MKTLLINLQNAILNNEHGNLTFPSFEGTNLETETEENLNYLAGNLIIDYNDSADHGSRNDEAFWDKYLEPIANIIEL